MNIIPLDERFRTKVDAYARDEWGGPMIVTLGNAYSLDGLPGFACQEDGRLLGAVLLRMEGDACEVALLFALVQGKGIGPALLDRAREAAQAAGCRRMWLVTTNDNTAAIRFYQRYGFALRAVHINSMDAVRAVKPWIPQAGIDGIPLAHEFEFEWMLPPEG